MKSAVILIEVQRVLSNAFKRIGLTHKTLFRSGISSSVETNSQVDSVATRHKVSNLTEFEDLVNDNQKDVEKFKETQRLPTFHLLQQRRINLFI